MLQDPFSQWAEIFPQALALVTREGVIQAANRRFLDLLGCGAEEVRGQALSRYVVTSDEEIHSWLGLCARSRQFVLGTLQLKLPSLGSDEGHVRSEGALFAPAQDGNPTGLLLRLTPRSEANQFTFLKQQIDALNTEIKLRRAAEIELAKQQRWLHVTLSSISDAIIATDTAARVVFMNPTASVLTGWALADAVGQDLETIFHIVNEETGLPVRNPAQRTLQEGVITGLANHTILISRNGSSVAIDDGAAPIRDEAGRIQGVVLVFHEVTNQRNLEKSLREQTQRLLEENRRKDEYLAMLAHELRNPLAPIANAFAVLKKIPGLPSIATETCHIGEGQLRHLRRLIDDLLDVSRMTHGKISLTTSRVDLSTIVSHAVTTMRPFLVSRDIDLEVTVAPQTIWVEADAFRFAQVVSNLLHNAGKYTAPQGRVTLRVTRDHQDALVSVRDTGSGIPETLLPYIFDLFVQGDQSLSRTEGGLGIGLTLVRSIVALHNGSIVAQSDGPERGSEFVVRIPLASPPDDAQALPPAATSQEVPTGLRILVVDDNPALVTTLATLLSLSGHQPETALNGTEALERSTTFQPHVVLLDIGLPGMDGFTVARQLRQRQSIRPLRIIAISGYGHAEYQDLGKAAGFDAYLVKPLDHDALDRLLATYIQDRDASA